MVVNVELIVAMTGDNDVFVVMVVKASCAISFLDT